MEIRRKVFSLLEDENGEERYYSTTEFEMEFDEETGEKMFSEKEEKKGMSKGKKAALIGTGAAVATVGGLELANILKKRHLTKSEVEELKRLKDTVGLGKEDLKAYVKDYRAGHKGIGFVEKGNKWVAETGKKALGAGKALVEKGKEKLKKTKKEV
jgi:hypothetical protein